MDPPSGSGDSTGAHQPPELPPPDGGDSSSNNTKNSSTKQQSKLHQNQLPSNVKDNAALYTATTVVTATTTTTASIPGTEGDISVLSLLYEFYSKTGRHPTTTTHDLHNFYEHWIRTRLPGVYENREQLAIKMDELHSRFLWNMKKDVDIPIGPINVNILQLSSYIWHNDIDAVSEEITHDHHDQDSGDLSDETSRIGVDDDDLKDA